MDKNYHLPGTPDDFIEANMKLAQKVAWGWVKYVKRNDNIKFDKDDLLSISYIGLIKAYQGFDPTKYSGKDGGNIKFSTYAVPVINGEIRRHIRDMGNTIKRSRTGEAFFVDSLDAPISEDGHLTVGDTVHVETYEIENQAIINDFISQTKPRLQNFYKMWARGMNQKEIGKSLGISQVQVSRLQNKLIDLAREYGGQPKVEKIKKGGIWKMATDNTKRMREEITTLEQFNSIGSGAVVARKYGIAIPTAYAWKRQLTDNEKGEAKVSVIKEDIVKMETTPFEIPNIVQNYKEINKLVEGREGMSKPLTDIEIDKCIQEAVNELIGIVEPEPPWNPILPKSESDTPRELDKILVAYSDEEIERQWQRIKTSLVILHNLHIERANMDFWTRAKMITEAMR